jgi:hypothetical protein
MNTLAGALRSKTIWFNVALLALGLADWIASSAPLISSIAPNSGPVLSVIAVVGGILRMVTTQGLGDKT